MAEDPEIRTSESPRDSDETVELLARARDGDRSALDDLLERHRGRLRRMVEFRMADTLRRRVDASDVIQEAFLEAAKRLPDFVGKGGKRAEERHMSFFLWLRWLTRERLITLHRRHVGTLARDPRREVTIHGAAAPGASSHALAVQLVSRIEPPSAAAIRAETRARLEDALDTLDATEREIITLRHFEQLSNAEAARELGIGEAAASKRYIRSLTRLRGILSALGLDPAALAQPSRGGRRES